MVGLSICRSVVPPVMLLLFGLLNVTFGLFTGLFTRILALLEEGVSVPIIYQYIHQFILSFFPLSVRPFIHSKHFCQKVLSRCNKATLYERVCSSFDWPVRGSVSFFIFGLLGATYAMYMVSVERRSNLHQHIRLFESSSLFGQRQQGLGSSFHLLCTVHYQWGSLSPMYHPPNTL